MRSSNKYRVKLIGGARLITIYSGNEFKHFVNSNLYQVPALEGFHLQLQITFFLLKGHVSGETCNSLVIKLTCRDFARYLVNIRLGLDVFEFLQ